MVGHRVALTLAALLLAACGTVEVTPPTVSAAPEPTALPATGRLFGALSDLDLEAASITIASAEFFGDPDPANAAARADGVIGARDTLPMPFYVRDLHEGRELALSPDTRVVVTGWDASGSIHPIRITLAEFVASWRTGVDQRWERPLFCWFSVVDGTVIGIEAQYIP